MSAVFYLGASTPLYTFTILACVIGFMILCRVDPYDLVARGVGKQIITPTLGGQPIAYATPTMILCLTIMLSYASMIEWWAQGGITYGYKVNWIISSMVISSIPLLAEVIGNWFGLLPIALPQVTISTTDGGKAGVGIVKYADAPIYKSQAYANALYAIYLIALTALLTMSIVCMTTFYGTGQVFANVAGQFVFASGIILFVFIMFDSFFKWKNTSPVVVPSAVPSVDPTYKVGGMPSVPVVGMMNVSGLTKTQELIAALEEKNDVQSITLSKLKLKENMESFKDLPSLSFARTGSLTFPRDVPENLFLHQMEREQLRPSNQKALDHKDFVAIQTNPDKVLLMSSQKARAFLEEVPGGQLNFPRTGILDNALTTGELKGTRNGFFWRIFDDEPGVIVYPAGVLGFGPGNGVSVNIPACVAWFLSIYFLAADIQIFRDSGYGLVFSMLVNLPAFCFYLVEHEQSYIPNMFLNRMVACAIVVVARTINLGNTSYLMTQEVLYNTTTPWMQDTSIDTAGELGAIITVSFTSYLVFVSLCLWALYSLVCLLYLAWFAKTGYKPLEQRR